MVGNKISSRGKSILGDGEGDLVLRETRGLGLGHQRLECHGERPGVAQAAAAAS